MLILHRSSLLLVTCALLASCASGEIPFEGPPAVTNPNNNPNNENNNTMEPPNTRPIAAQVPSGAARVGETITLDGSGSMDPDGDVLSFSWTLDARPTGSAARILDADQPIALLVPDLPGEYLVTLVVNDGKISSGDLSALHGDASGGQPRACGRCGRQSPGRHRDGRDAGRLRLDGPRR
jgi:hypothetical protein